MPSTLLIVVNDATAVPHHVPLEVHLNRVPDELGAWIAPVQQRLRAVLHALLDGLFMDVERLGLVSYFNDR